MATPHLAIIDPAVRIPELDCYNQIALRSQIHTSYHLPGLFGMDSLVAVQDSVTALMILVSSSSVNDRLPWQSPLEIWLKQQLEKGKPTLGLCYGHQLLAYLFGGKVDFIFSNRHKLQGFRKITLSKNPLWNNQELAGEIYVSHREAVVECPQTMQIIATSSEVAIDGLSHKTLPIWSLQGHPESTTLFLKNMGDRHNVGPQAFDFGRKLIDLFLAHVQRV
jgi:GMP synthase (glutamine-hydrolysing)